jgi:hypothetical protein
LTTDEIAARNAAPFAEAGRALARDERQGGAPRAQPVRAKALGFAAFSQSPAPLPAVAELLAPPSLASAAAAETAEQRAAAAARRAAAALRRAAAGVELHDNLNGDNPPPEAIVFAFVPAAARAIADVVRPMPLGLVAPLPKEPAADAGEAVPEAPASAAVASAVASATEDGAK